jgi:hypothetical protein
MNKVGIGVIAVLILVVAAGGAFYAGTKVGENRVLQDPASFLQRLRPEGGQSPGRFFGQQGTPVPGQTPQPGFRGGQGLGGTLGTIEEVDGNTLILSTQEGTVRVETTDTTLIEKYASVQVGDLKVGEQVVVSGSENSDGSLTARSIRSLQGIQFSQFVQQ